MKTSSTAAASLLQLGLDRVCTAHRDPLEVMCTAFVEPDDFEAAVRALHAVIPLWTRWRHGYGDSDRDPYRRIRPELDAYLAKCDLRRLLSLFGAAVREQARAGCVPAGEQR